GVGACYRHQSVVKVVQELSAVEVGVEVWDGATVRMIGYGDVLPVCELIEIVATEGRSVLRLCTSQRRPLHLIRVPRVGRLLLRVSLLAGHGVRVEEINADDRCTSIAVLWDSRE